MTPAQTNVLGTDLPLFAGGLPEPAEHAAQFLKSLAQRDRLKVLCCLLDGEVPVADLEAAVGISLSAVSQHLAKLRDEKIVSAHREGLKTYYAIADPIVRDIVSTLCAWFCRA